MLFTRLTDKLTILNIFGKVTVNITIDGETGNLKTTEVRNDNPLICPKCKTDPCLCDNGTGDGYLMM